MIHSSPSHVHCGPSVLPLTLVLTLLAGFLGLPLPLLADAPNLRDILPVGLVRGESVALHLYGERLDDARALQSYDGPGLVFSAPKILNAGEIEVPVQVAADCPLGEHRVRLRTATGWSYIRTLWVGTEPRLAETEPNNEMEKAQKVTLPVGLEGEVKSEDVDLFAVDLAKGQRLTAVVESIRLGRTLLDLHVSVLDGKRFELAASDDTALLGQDPFVSVAAPEAGTYFVQVREAAYEGADGARYRLRLTGARQPMAVYPPGGVAGAQEEVRFLFPDGTEEARPLTWPAAGTRMISFAEADGTLAPAQLPVRVDTLPGLRETEPNNAKEQATGGAAGVPVALHGLLQQKGDEDWFSVPLKKGQGIEVAAWGRRLGSAIDPAIDVFAPSGKHMGGNDDFNNKPDSYHSFTAEEDGPHFIKVRDSLAAGGPAFVYRIEVRPLGPALGLSLPSPGVNDSQAGQTVLVPQNNRVARVFNVTRTRTGGDLALDLRGSPPGLKLIANPVPNAAGQALVLFEAAPDAPEGGAFADFVARKADDGLEGRYSLAANLVIYRNNEPIYQTTTDRLAAGVGPAAPARIRLEPQGPLVQGGLADLKVVVERSGDFKAALEISLPWKPGGVSAPPTVTIPEGANEVAYPLDAEPGAAVGSHTLTATARWGTGFEVAAPFQPLVVEEPYVRGSFEMGAVNVGQTGSLLLKVEHVRPFEGEAEVQVLGAPAGIEISPAKVKAGQTEVLFTVKCAPEAPVGKHASLFCRAAIPVGGRTVIHRLGTGGVLRVDKPAPAVAAAAPAAPAPPPQPGAPPPKPLSRLEQLRQRNQGK